MIEFSIPPATVLGLVVSTVLPLLVGLVTKTVTNGGVKAVLLAALAAVTGLGSELLNAIQSGSAYDLGQGLFVALTGFLVATGMHFGLWKPTTLAGKAQSVGTKPADDS